MEFDSRKKTTRDRMMRSKRFGTQEVREIDRMEAGKSGGFLILWMRIMEDVLQMERKKCKVQKNVKKKIHARANKVL